MITETCNKNFLVLLYLFLSILFVNGQKFKYAFNSTSRTHSFGVWDAKGKKLRFPVL